MVLVITTPTKSHSHKVCLITVAFICDAVSTCKVHKNQVPTKILINQTAFEVSLSVVDTVVGFFMHTGLCPAILRTFVIPITPTTVSNLTGNAEPL